MRVASVSSANCRFFFFKQKTAYDITEGDWSSDVCSSDLFKGVLLALGLYVALLLRLVQNAQRAKDRAGMFLVMGVAAALGFHVLVNVAMVIGAMPVTGIPLPLMSYGGSATLFVFLAIGLVMNVRLRRFVN